MTQIKQLLQALTKVGPVGVRWMRAGGGCWWYLLLVACTVPGVPSGEVLIWKGWLASEPLLGEASRLCLRSPALSSLLFFLSSPSLELPPQLRLYLVL